MKKARALQLGDVMRLFLKLQKIQCPNLKTENIILSLRLVIKENVIFCQEYDFATSKDSGAAHCRKIRSTTELYMKKI
jgi:hypothetical protein